MKHIFCIIGAAVLLAGCAVMNQSAVAPRTVIGSADDYGQYPTNYEHLVNVWLKVYMKDPDSVKDLKVFGPSKFFLSAPSMDAAGYMTVHHYPLDTQIYGYLVNFYCNAKNSYGAYEGSQMHSIFIRDGEIVEALEE